MKKLHIIFWVVILVFGANAQSKAKKNFIEKPSVLVVGSYHMANPGRDLNNMKVDDVLARKRQKEIVQFVELLKIFKPTKIAVEMPVTNEELNSDYSKYLENKYELTANEVDQIGFRLAKQLHHKQIYTIDWQGNFDFDKMSAAAKEYNQTPLLEPLMKFGKEITEQLEKKQKTSTVTQIYHFLNDENFVNQSHTPYIQLLRIGKGENYQGADLVKDWYERNLKIFTNILRITTSPNDRILVLIGAGHVKLLNQLAKESDLYTVEKTSKYF